ncbi:MAG: nucleotide exchange factor GrpE [Lachnospiraceae bacterium]|nr:nucleotide exchange factor GrpE [Lachnospiraceae bacterium]MDY5742858.1 nucleotide exchange factor GrpE [Lachnospiraceae bacterium]
MKNKHTQPETVLEPEIPETETVGTDAEEEALVTEEASTEETKAEETKAKKDPKDEKIEELSDKVLRQMAEFDNYRKRTEKEKAANYDIGAKEVVEKLLPILDNFERGLAIREEGEADPFYVGMQMIYKQMLTMFEEIGVKAIEAVGQPFDPEFHNAVIHVEDETVGENEVVEEFQKGYLYKEYVVRHSMVKVAN